MRRFRLLAAIALLASGVSASQYDYGTIDPATKSGTALASDLNNARDAWNSLHRGSSRPAYAVAGMLWVDDSAAPVVTLKFYDGAADIPVRTLNETDNLAFLALPSAAGAPSSSEKYQLHVDETSDPVLDIQIRNKADTAWVKLGELSGSTWTPWSQGAELVPGVALSITQQVFTSTGSYSKPAGLLYARFYGVGAGGGGAHSDVAGGGGAGGYSDEIIDEASLSASTTITIGAGGAAGTGGGAGSNGGDSYVGTLGSELLKMAGGSGALPGTAAGGVGGVGSLGTLNLDGGRGRTSYGSNGGNGGDSVLGQGGSGGKGGLVNAYDGTGPGAGGGSAGWPAGAGNGADGMIVVISYIEN